MTTDFVPAHPDSQAFVLLFSKHLPIYVTRQESTEDTPCTVEWKSLMQCVNVSPLFSNTKVQCLHLYEQYQQCLHPDESIGM